MENDAHLDYLETQIAEIKASQDVIVGMIGALCQKINPQFDLSGLLVAQKDFCQKYQELLRQARMPVKYSSPKGVKRLLVKKKKEK